MNPPYINFDGKIISSEEPVFYSTNRAMKYGDGLFESMKVSNSRILFAEEHYKRLLQGLGVLKMKAPEDLSLSHFIDSVIDLCEKNKFKNARLRFQVFRKQGEFYAPSSSEISFLIEAASLEDELFHFNSKGLEVDVFPTFLKSKNIYSNFKTSNSIGSVMASLFAKENNLDDCFLLNTDGNIAESATSNIFVLIKKQIITPPLSDGCVDGVMRRQVIQLIQKQGILFDEISVSPGMLAEAEEVFLTSAVRGIRWVGNFKKKPFEKIQTEKLAAALSSLVSRQ